MTVAGGPATGRPEGRRASWWESRSPAYIARRTRSLVRRYGLTPTRAARRAEACADLLARHGTAPVFMVPGRVMERNGAYFRALQARGVELGLHSYDHVDFRSLGAPAVARQMMRAASAFSACGVGFEGFRCPYLGYDDRVPGALPPGLVAYSSNRAIWREELVVDEDGATAVFGQLRRFYDAVSSRDELAVPRRGPGFVEIPCAVPDDLQLFDGLRLDEEGVARAWTTVLDATHDRGEAFVVLFHPELLDRVGPALDALLTEARRRRPAVWLATLRDISQWCDERSRFAWLAAEGPGGPGVELDCSGRATILVRGLDAPDAEAWHGAYRVTPARSVTFPPGTRPLVGVASDVPAEARALLADEGYLLDEERPDRCVLRVDGATVARAGSAAALIEHLESSDAPLVRFWRWPGGARSALAVTGDLDALSLVDYASRLTPGARSRSR